MDEIGIQILDEQAEHEDLIVNAFDDIVFIRQWDEELGRFHTVTISPSQWEELISAIDSPEGAFILKRNAE